MKAGDTVQTELGPAQVLYVEGDRAFVMGPFGMFWIKIKENNGDSN